MFIFILLLLLLLVGIIFRGKHVKLRANHILGLKSIGSVCLLSVLLLCANTASAQISRFCKELNSSNTHNCTFEPDSFSEWLFGTGYEGPGPEVRSLEESAQRSLNFITSNHQLCSKQVSIGASAVLERTNFINDTESALWVVTQAPYSYVVLYEDGECSTTPVQGVFNIYAQRQAQCNVGWLDWDFVYQASYCSIEPSPAASQTVASASCDAMAVGNPIYPASEEKIQNEIDFTDLGPAPLSWARIYRSGWWAAQPAPKRASSNLGTAWGNNHSMALVQTGRDNGRIFIATLSTDDGTVYQFNRTAEQTEWQSTTQVGQLSQSATGQWRFDSTEEDSTRYFSASGQLQSVVQRNGWRTTYTYNAAGLLSQISNSFGRSLNLAYNAQGQLIRLTTPEQRNIDYLYDTQGRLVSVSYPDATSRHYLYENTLFPLALTGIKDEAGNYFARYSYDPQGRAISTENAGGVNRYQVSYRTSGASVIDPLGTARDYYYVNRQGQWMLYSSSAVSNTGLADIKIQHTDDSGLITEQIDFENNTKQMQWDTQRRLPTLITRAAGSEQAQVSQIEWHPKWRLPIQQTEQGKETRIGYDDAGNPLSQTVTDSTTGTSQTWHWSYNPQGLVASQTAPNGGVSRYSYDSSGNLTQLQNALGQVSQYSFDAGGRITQIRASNGLMTRMGYDARGRLLSQSTGEGSASQNLRYSYTATGQLAQAKLPDGHQINYQYDAAQRLVGWSDNRGANASYVLDAIGNQVESSLKDSQGKLVWHSSQTMNALNRVSQLQVGEAGQASTQKYAYNDNADLRQHTDGLDNTTWFYLDSLRRITAVADANNATAELHYNSQDAVVSASDFNGQTTLYGRETIQGQATSEHSADIGQTHIEYDALGLVKSMTDALGQTSAFERDALGRTTQVHTADGKNIKFVWDRTGVLYNSAQAPQGTSPNSPAASVGYLSEIQEPSGSTRYQRDAFGRVVAKHQTTLVPGPYASQNYSHSQTLGYRYNAAGQLTGIDYPNNNRLSYSYNNTGELIALLWNNQPLVANIQWSPLGHATQWSWVFNSRKFPAYRDYDSAGRLSSSEFSSYRFDANGRISELIQQGMPSQVSYDSVGRVSQIAHPDFTERYRYDANGNRTSSQYLPNNSQAIAHTKTYEISGNHALSVTHQQQVGSAAAQSTTTQYLFNGAGNLLQEGSRSYGYDVQGRLASVQNTASGNTSSANSAPTYYRYNALGQRVLKYQNFYGQAKGRGYLYDEDGTLLSETEVSLGTSSHNYNSSYYIYLPTANGPMPVAVQIKGQWFAIQADHLNTPRRLMATNGQVAWQWAFSAFGDNAPEVSKAGATSTVEFNLRFPGQYFDQESGLHYNYHRYYDAQTGRYIQADPIGLGGGWNRFGYVGGDAVNKSDPFGLCPWCAGAAMGGISGGIGAFTTSSISGQSGWNLVGSTVAGAVIGAGVGVITFNPAAAAEAGSALVVGSVGRAVFSASVTNAVANAAGQGVAMSLDNCAEFSVLQVGLSAIPGPTTAWNPLAIASRYRTGGIFESYVGSHLAAGMQIGILGSIRGTSQLMVEQATYGNDNACMCRK